MAITKISFLAQYVCLQEIECLHFVPEIRDTVTIVEVARVDKTEHKEFVLGPGPCGKTVDKLDVRYQEHDIVIIQYHDDGTLKEFPYQRKDVLGRLTIERSVLQ